METDLLIQLFEMWVSRTPPDILSLEWPDDETPMIRVFWFNGKSCDYGYTKQRYDAVWKMFNEYWNLHNNH